MRINQLTLTNFRGFEQRSFEFDPQFNLIIGNNASGKTGLIEGLERACASFFLGIGNQHATAITEDDVRRVPILQGDVVTIEPQYPVIIKADGVVTNQTITWSRALEGKGGRTTSKDAKSIRGKAENLAKLVQDGQPALLPFFSHYGTGRLWVQPRDMRGNPAGEKKASESRLESYRFSNDPRIEVAELMRWLKRERYVSLEKGSDRMGFKAAKEAIRSCLPGCQSVEYSVIEQTLVLEIDGKGSQPFHLLSDGQRIMVGLVADIAIKAAILNPHLGERVLEETCGVVLIDEIDLHLHPRWQRHIVADLKRTFPGIQFFATTHSPQVIGETPPQQIIKLEPDGSWSNPDQTIGLSSDEILEFIMEASVRNMESQQDLKRLEQLLGDAEFEQAHGLLSEMRKKYNGELKDIAAAESYMAQMELLAEEE
jgi:predicted ATP-binding protein involved in virulence